VLNNPLWEIIRSGHPTILGWPVPEPVIYELD